MFQCRWCGYPINKWDYGSDGCCYACRMKGVGLAHHLREQAQLPGTRREPHAKDLYPFIKRVVKKRWSPIDAASRSKTLRQFIPRVVV